MENLNGALAFKGTLDIDDFKSLNDRRGHAAGDHLLRSAGYIIKESFGKEHCYRYGGDEFLVIREIDDEFDKEGIIERINEVVEAIGEVVYDDEPLNVHFSAGYVCGKPENVNSLRDMLRKADERLYKAKHLGKNLCVGDKDEPLIIKN